MTANEFEHTVQIEKANCAVQVVSVSSQSLYSAKRKCMSSWTDSEAASRKPLKPCVTVKLE